jgi:hypothetical protein
MFIATRGCKSGLVSRRKYGVIAKAGQSGDFEMYKSSHHFDGTYQNPQWLG